MCWTRRSPYPISSYRRKVDGLKKLVLEAWVSEQSPIRHKVLLLVSGKKSGNPVYWISVINIPRKSMNLHLMVVKPSRKIVQQIDGNAATADFERRLPPIHREQSISQMS